MRDAAAGKPYAFTYSREWDLSHSISMLFHNPYLKIMFSVLNKFIDE
jgi:hypothetical protein